MAEYLLQPDDSTSLAIDQADDFEAEADQDQDIQEDIQALDVQALAIRCNDLHLDLDVRPTLAKARKIGTMLIEVQGRGVGPWEKWVEEHLTFSLRTAQVYMQVARFTEAEVAEAQAQTSAPLSIDGMSRIMRKAKKAARRQEKAEKANNLPMVGIKDQGLVHADSLGWMRGQPGESFHFFATDAPFGFGTQYDGWI